MRRLGIEQANASQHLSVLRNKHVVESRREGNQVLYRLHDPIFARLLDSLRIFYFEHIRESLDLIYREQHGKKKRLRNKTKNEAEYRARVTS